MSHYVVPRSTYFIVFALLIVLLVLTVLAARQDLDGRTGIAGLNVMIALAIAAAKAVLIVLFFMQIKYASPLQRVFAASGALFLTILFAITFADYLSRGPWDVNPGDLQEPEPRQQPTEQRHDDETDDDEPGAGVDLLSHPLRPPIPEGARAPRAAPNRPSDATAHQSGRRAGVGAGTAEVTTRPRRHPGAAGPPAEPVGDAPRLPFCTALPSGDRALPDD